MARTPGESEPAPVTGYPGALFHEDLPYPGMEELRALDERLRLGLEAAVYALKFSSVMVLAEEDGQPVSPPDDLDQFRLVPLTGPKTRERGAWSFERTSEHTIVPQGVATNYRVPGGNPYLDTLTGVGLVYRDELRALAGAATSDAGHLMITQLQACGPLGIPWKERQGNGLHSGILWRPTLVCAVMGVARQTGHRTVGVQAARNSDWSVINGGNGKPPRTDGYDAVARYLGFDPDIDGNFVKIV